MADTDRMRCDAAAIWAAAIAAVQPDGLVSRRLSIMGETVLADGRPLDPPLALDRVERIVVVGGGKAAGGMAAGLEALLGPERLARHRVTGLVSVPEGCGRRLSHVAVRETRPAGVNLPTAAAVAATREMGGMLAALGPRDLAIALITGGGSALLALPRDGVPLEEKVAVSRFLAQAGADIRELNLVRQAASGVKAGGLARACGAGRLVALVLSDVIGDPLDVIASGPCMPIRGRPRDALAVLANRNAIAAGIAPRLVAALAAEVAAAPATGGGAADAAGAAGQAEAGRWTTPAGCLVEHLLLGDNRTALDAAAARARGCGYDVRVRPAVAGSETEAAAEVVGGRLAAEGVLLAAETARDGIPRVWLEGGEATVTVPADHGRGGRNQQTVLASIAAVRGRGAWPTGLLLASVGTDGEDGPTTAAGGMADATVVAAIDAHGLDVSGGLARCDAHPLLAAAGGLITTGPTGTNVADLRIVLARP